MEGSSSAFNTGKFIIDRVKEEGGDISLKDAEETTEHIKKIGVHRVFCSQLVSVINTLTDDSKNLFDGYEKLKEMIVQKKAQVDLAISSPLNAASKMVFDGVLDALCERVDKENPNNTYYWVFDAIMSENPTGLACLFKSMFGEGADSEIVLKWYMHLTVQNRKNIFIILQELFFRSLGMLIHLKKEMLNSGEPLQRWLNLRDSFQLAAEKALAGVVTELKTDQ